MGLSNKDWHDSISPMDLDNLIFYFTTKVSISKVDLVSNPQALGKDEGLCCHFFVIECLEIPPQNFAFI